MIFFKSVLEYKKYLPVHVFPYLKVICYTKKQWLELLDEFNTLSDVDGKVILFAKKVCANLDAIGDNDFYIAIYVGETSMLFHDWISNNSPYDFLSLSPTTHVFQFCLVGKGIFQHTRKAVATYVMEVFMVVLLEKKLGQISYVLGHFLNVQIVGYRSYLGVFGIEQSTYISFEKEPHDTIYKPKKVHIS